MFTDIIQTTLLWNATTYVVYLRNESWTPKFQLIVTLLCKVTTIPPLVLTYSFFSQLAPYHTSKRLICDFYSFLGLFPSSRDNLIKRNEYLIKRNELLPRRNESFIKRNELLIKRNESLPRRREPLPRRRFLLKRALLDIHKNLIGKVKPANWTILLITNVTQTCPDLQNLPHRHIRHIVLLLEDIRKHNKKCFLANNRVYVTSKWNVFCLTWTFLCASCAYVVKIM